MSPSKQIQNILGTKIPAFIYGNGPLILSVDPGWIPLVLKFCDSVVKYDLEDLIEIYDIKQKIGKLKITVRCDRLQGHARYKFGNLLYEIGEIQEEALEVCEVCSEPGELNTYSHMATLCSAHKHYQQVSHEEFYEAQWKKQIQAAQAWIDSFNE